MPDFRNHFCYRRSSNICSHYIALQFNYTAFLAPFKYWGKVKCIFFLPVILPVSSKVIFVYFVPGLSAFCLKYVYVQQKQCLNVIFTEAPPCSSSSVSLQIDRICQIWKIKSKNFGDTICYMTANKHFPLLYNVCGNNIWWFWGHRLC